MLTAISKGVLAVTLLQQNLPVLNWWYQITQVGWPV